MISGKILSSIKEIDKEVFNKIVQEKSLESWVYYRALEESNALSLEKGWIPRYVVFDNDNHIVGFCPLFIKMHSEGEFSFDHCYVKEYENITKQTYYPKAQICLPYMPLHTKKMYFKEGYANHIVSALDWVKKYCWSERLGSLHISLPQEEHGLFYESGFFSHSHHLCYWYNKNYNSFSDFLSFLRSKYRSQILKERECISKVGLSLEICSGDLMNEEKLEKFFKILKTTYARKNWGPMPLDVNFFRIFCKLSPSHIVFFFLKNGDEVVATACNFMNETTLFGRFWGSLTDNDFLQFEICYYVPMQFAIENKLMQMETGFCKKHKVIRGFLPQVVHNFHIFRDSSFQNRIYKKDNENPFLYQNIYKMDDR